MNTRFIWLLGTRLITFSKDNGQQLEQLKAAIRMKLYTGRAHKCLYNNSGRKPTRVSNLVQSPTCSPLADTSLYPMRAESLLPRAHPGRPHAGAITSTTSEELMPQRKPQRGFGKVFRRLRNQGYPWNHKRVRRVYRAQLPSPRIKPKKRLLSRQPIPLAQPKAINESCSVDFMSDSLQSGRNYRTGNAIDDFNRKAQAIEIDASLPSAHRCIVVISIDVYTSKEYTIYAVA